MSNLNDNGELVECPNQAGAPTLKPVTSRKSILGSGLPIIRHLPSRDQRLIGPWCFLDHIGPTSLSEENAVDVGTHPHTGLQTVTWLFEGALLHKDSLGYEQVIEPGQLNLMTAGHGICHSEESPPGFSGPMHGLQFWIALPQWQQDGIHITLVVGELAGQQSPAKVFSPLVGADIEAPEGGSLTLPVPASFELGLCINEGSANLEGRMLEVGELYYLGQGREQLTLTLEPGSRVMLLGGEPLHQPVLLWWNFVGRNQTRLEQAVADWNAWPNDRFGDVAAYQGKPLKAPRLDPQVRLKG